MSLSYLLTYMAASRCCAPLNVDYTLEEDCGFFLHTDARRSVDSRTPLLDPGHVSKHRQYATHFNAAYLHNRMLVSNVGTHERLPLCVMASLTLESQV